MTVTPIHGELRQAAHDRLVELATELMRCAQSLFLKSSRIMNPDPKAHNRVIGNLKTYQKYELPGSDQVRLIEALLTGTSPEQCQSRAEKVRLEKAACEQKRSEMWDRINNSPNPREAWERTDFSGKKKKGRRAGRERSCRPLEQGRDSLGARRVHRVRGRSVTALAWRASAEKPGFLVGAEGRNIRLCSYPQG